VDLVIILLFRPH